MTTRNFRVYKDTRVKRSFSGSTKSGAGSSYYLDVGPLHGSTADWEGRVIIQFSLDFTGIPDSVASKLKMRVTGGNYEARGGSNHVRIRRITGAAWAEGTYPSDHGPGFSTSNATVAEDYTTTSSGQVWATLTGVGTGGWTDVDISSIVLDWKHGADNRGIEIAAANAAHDGLDEQNFARTIEFYASESSSDPYIENTFITNVAPSVTLDSPTVGTVIEMGEAHSPTAGPPVYGTTPDIRVKVTPTDPDADNTIVAWYASYSLDGSTWYSVWSGTVSWASGVQQTLDLDTANANVAAPLVRGTTLSLRVAVEDSAGGVSAFAVVAGLVLNDTSYPTITLPTTGHVARLDMQSGWTRPRFRCDWTYADPEADAQSAYQVHLYADAAGPAPGAEVTSTGWVSGAAATSTFDYSGITSGTYYWLKVQTKDARGLTKGLQTGSAGAVRVRARFSSGQFYFDIGATPTGWSVAVDKTDGATGQVVIEYGSRPSGDGTPTAPPTAYMGDLGSVTLGRYFHYRVWLLAHGSATPTSPRLNKLTLNYTSGAGTTIVPDNWSLPTNCSVDTGSYAYGRQSLKFVGDAGLNWRQAYQGNPALGQTPIVLQPDTDYILSAKLRTVGAPDMAVRVLAVDGTSLVCRDGYYDVRAVAAADQQWSAAASVSHVYRTGSAAQQVMLLVEFRGSAAQQANVDAIQFEASSVVTPWKPGAVGVPGVAFDAGGLQISKVGGGLLRLLGGAGDVSRNIIELSTNGLRFGSDGPDVYSPLAGMLHIGGGRLAEMAAPGTPPSGFGYLYPDTSGNLHWKNDSGTDYTLGTAQVESYCTSNVTMTDAGTTYASGASVTLGVGTWEVEAHAEVASGATGTILRALVYLYDGTDALDEASIQCPAISGFQSGNNSYVRATVVVATGTKTITLRGVSATAGAVIRASGLSNSQVSNRSTGISARRVA